jgi:hypothetical protein
MTEVGRKRLSGMKIFGLISGAVLLLLLATALWMKLAVDRSWAEWDQELKATIAAERARSGERPVLWGEPTPGNAWDEYDLALAAIPKQSGGRGVGEILDPKHDDKPDGALARLPQYASSIAHLRAGAHRASSRKDYEWEKAGGAATPSFAAVNQIPWYVLLEARVQAKEGRPSEAVGEILDVMQFGRDFASDGPIISHTLGSMVLGGALLEARDLLTSGVMDAPSRERLEHGLRTLLGEFPTSEDAMLRECIFMDSALHEVAGPNFATGSMFLSAARRQREWIRNAAAASRVSWAELLKVERENQAQIDRAWNPFVKMGIASLTHTYGKNSRQWRAQISMLLAGVHFQRTGEVLDLDDPFGTKLLSSKTGDALKIWSIGPDGIDNQGAGGWYAKDGPDIVLDVKR